MLIGGRPASEQGGGGPRTTGNAGGPGGMMIGGRPAHEQGMGGPRTTGNDGMGAQRGSPFAKAPQDQNQNVGGNVAQVQVAQTCDILLRFFDVTVEEGHTYQYQVHVALKNPNYKLPPGVLENPKSAEPELLVSAYSEPTEPVRVAIGGTEVIAGPTRAGKPENGTAESVTAILRQRDRTKAALLAHTFNRLEAGQVLNLSFKEPKEIKFEKPVGGIDTTAAVPFQSDNLILDIRGGGERGWPGEMLLLDSGGRLVLQSEVGKSKPTFAEESKRLEEVYNRQEAAPAGGPVGNDPFGGLFPGGAK
jgi:hypothetical protein